ncbi:MAG: hypothetical protein M1825_001706 [Sarcosagium campestre]|nr:MAG: hypothetical protein M1825_001706 [Sarcosagium campestre]
MEPYGLLDQIEEDALHKSRLLSVEEKPFKRITKRLLAPDTLLSRPPRHLPTPPPDASGADELALELENERQRQAEHYRQFREDIQIDFTAFESSMARVQFLLTSNEKERARYAHEKQRISERAQTVRESTAQLRVKLDAAQQKLALRKTWDELTEKHASNRLLRPRADQHANLEKLNAEIAELERESSEYAHTWAERREQFGRIIKEGMELRRLIRDEKEEVERREGMEEHEDGEDGDVDAGAAASGRADASNVGTPRPTTEADVPLPQPNTQAGSGSGSGSGSSQEAEQAAGAGAASTAHLRVARERTPAVGSPLGRFRSPAPASPPRSTAQGTRDDGEDTNMAEQGEVADDDGGASPTQKNADQREEGEEDEDEGVITGSEGGGGGGGGEGDTMDTT